MAINEMIEAIQNGHDELLIELWNAVKDLVRWAANRYFAISDRNCGCEVDDLVQAGYIAMVSAIKTFDSSREKQFSTWLMFYLKREFASAMCLVYSVDDEGRQRKKVSFLDTTISLDDPIPGEDESAGTIVDTIPDLADPFEATEQRIFIEELHAALDNYINTLTESEAEVIRGVYFNGETLGEIAERRGFTNSRAGQIKDKGLRKLRQGARVKQEGKALLPFVNELAIDQRTNFYSRPGLSAYLATGTSSVEDLTLKREDMRRELFNGTREA